MPPRPNDSDDDAITSDDDTTTESTTTEESEATESSESEGGDFSPAQSGAQGGAAIKNAPHDEEFAVAGGGASAPPAAAAPGARGGAAPGAGGAAVQNQPHDEEFAVAGGGKPAPSNAAAAPGRAPAPSGGGGGKGGRGGMISNDHADEFEDVEDDMTDDEDDVPTPQKGPAAASSSSGAAAAGSMGGRDLKNTSADFEIAVAPSTVQPAAMSTGSSGVPSRAAAGAPPPGNRMAPPSDDEDTDEDSAADSDSESSEGPPPTFGGGGSSGNNMAGAPGALAPSNIPVAVSVEYNPADYAHVTNSVPADVRDLFSYITAFQATTMELPAKLKPFIPDFIPSVGDIDTFCKVPRPDDKPDNFGLVVVDEPSSKMSNPAIVTTWLSHVEKVSATFVEGILSTVDDAANQPQLVDKWISDLRETQAQKAPPTVYYSKPMPAIESLMQEWPRGFEDVLNSDLQLPPPNIDLDIEQYVKMICAILDVPVHNNLVESLHVIFTLYLEFRENQHFKAA